MSDHLCLYIENMTSLFMGVIKMSKLYRINGHNQGKIELSELTI